MVKYSKYPIVILAVFSTLFFSCQEGGEAGNLIGQWRMTESDTKYISFSGSVSLFRNLWNGELHEVYANFQHINDSLFIQCVSIEGNPIDTTIVEIDYGFAPFTNIRTKIEVLDSEQLILSKDGKKWSFYKY